MYVGATKKMAITRQAAWKESRLLSKTATVTIILITSRIDACMISKIIGIMTVEIVTQSHRNSKAKRWCDRFFHHERYKGHRQEEGRPGVSGMRRPRREGRGRAHGATWL